MKVAAILKSGRADQKDRRHWYSYSNRTSCKLVMSFRHFVMYVLNGGIDCGRRRDSLLDTT